MTTEQTDRGRLDYATDSISAYTSIDDGEQRYETEEGTIHKNMQPLNPADAITLRQEQESSSDENMEDLGDEGECSSYVSPKPAGQSTISDRNSNPLG